MMLTYIFLGVTAILALWGIEKQRRTWAILAIMTLVSIFTVDIILVSYDSPYVLLVYGALEVLTVWLLVNFASGSLARIQVNLLLVAWGLHWTTFIDLEIGTNMVYSNYELLILAVVLLQLSLGFNGIFDIFNRAYFRILASFAIRSSGLPPVSARVENAEARQGN